MKSHFRTLGIVVASLAIVGFSSSAFAHYLWVAIDSKTGDYGTANIYFEEGPSPGDGHYLDPIAKTGKLWIRTADHPEPKEIETHETTAPKQRWLSAELADAGPRSIDTYGKFGVYAYGKTNVLLHYYARCLDVETHEDLHDLARAEHLDLDIIPHDHGDEMQLKVIWKGEPAANRPMRIIGPKKFRADLTTDDNGKVRFDITEPGTYLFRTSVELDETGTDGDDEYVLIRHHATMKITLPLK
ncbi:MAG: DUF4198 domain-containing protein [Planctomycetota bacterium]|nr:DUF4198 domain-containing protein [Planctomycetota bacterium]MDA1213538.1 DUF4198 domain-containing protein [Planctomycetota bacterium]